MARLDFGPARLSAGQSRARAVASSTDWVPQVDVAVIGGGIIGCATALMLARRGVSVAIYEKGVVAGEASGRAQGHVTTLFQDAVKIPLIARSRDLWAELAAELGTDIFAPTPAVKYCDDPVQADAAEAWAGAVNVPFLRLSRSEIAARLPDCARLPKAAYCAPRDGLAEPRLAAPRIAEAARAAGALLYQGCAVRGIERSAGRCCAIVTERGPVRVQAVVVAGGLWSPSLLRGLGLRLPQIEAHGSVLRAELVAAPPGAGSLDGVSWRQDVDGIWNLSAQSGIAPVLPFQIRDIPVMLAALRAMSDHVAIAPAPLAFLDARRRRAAPSMERPGIAEQMRVAVPPLRMDFLDGLITRLRRRFPGLREIRLLENWSGVLTTTPDNLPVLSKVDPIPGLFVASGVYFGLTMGPGAGELLADLILGTPPRVDPAPFRLSRFDHPKQLRFHA